MGTHRFSGNWLRVLTEQKVPGVGAQSVQFHVVKEMVAEAVVARRRVRGAKVCMVWFWIWIWIWIYWGFFNMGDWCFCGLLLLLVWVYVCQVSRVHTGLFYISP